MLFRFIGKAHSHSQLTSCTISRGRILSPGSTWGHFLLHRSCEEMRQTDPQRPFAGEGPSALEAFRESRGEEFHRPETPPSASPYRPDDLENPPLGVSLNSWQHKTVFLKNVTEEWSTATLYWEYWLWISSWSHNRHEARSGVRHNTHLDLPTLLSNLLDKGQTFFIKHIPQYKAVMIISVQFNSFNSCSDTYLFQTDNWQT